MPVVPLTPPPSSIFARFSPRGRQDRLRVALTERYASDHFSLYSGPATPLEHASLSDRGAHAWLWGHAGARGVTRDGLLGWAMSAVLDGRPEALKAVSGSYLLLVYDERDRRLHLVTDLLGVRPCLVNARDRDVVIGSDAWTMRALGWTSGQTSAAAISSWICFNYNLTDAALFEDLRRPGPAAYESFDASLARSAQRYAVPAPEGPAPDPKRYPELLHEAAFGALEAQAAGVPKVSVALSGGFDSRYLLAAYLEHLGGSATATVVDLDPGELQPARQVAERLGVPLEVAQPGLHRSTGSLWDFFDEPLHYFPDGFPITKQFTFHGAANSGGAPLLNGYLGDLLMRGTRATCDGRHEWECHGDLVDVAYPDFEVIGPWAGLLEPAVLRGARRHAHRALRALMARDGGFGYPFRYADLFGRQRHYISNNVNQCLAFGDPILPFLNFELMQLRFAVGRTLPNLETYKQIFRRYLPKIADVPHSSEIPAGPPVAYRLGVKDAAWAREVLASLPRRRGASALRNRGALKAIVNNLLLARPYPLAITHLYRLHAFEQACARFGVEPDWDEIRSR